LKQWPFFVWNLEVLWQKQILSSLGEELNSVHGGPRESFDEQNGAGSGVLRHIT
jgi:hypothetical protein